MSAALIAMIRGEKFNADDTVVFLHTGGNAVLPAYTEEL